jgi:hypothetical protein
MKLTAMVKDMEKKIKTYVEYLKEILDGKEPKPKCVGGVESMPQHEITEYVLIIGKYWFSFGCPKCGFGTGGSLSEKDHEILGC